MLLCTIYMTVLTLNFLQRNAYAEINDVKKTQHNLLIV